MTKMSSLYSNYNFQTMEQLLPAIASYRELTEHIELICMCMGMNQSDIENIRFETITGGQTYYCLVTHSVFKCNCDSDGYNSYCDCRAILLRTQIPDQYLTMPYKEIEELTARAEKEKELEAKRQAEIKKLAEAVRAAEASIKVAEMKAKEIEHYKEVLKEAQEKLNALNSQS